MSSDRRESRHLSEDFSFRPAASLEMTCILAPTSRPVLSGFRRFRSDIPLRLRRGGAKSETSTFARTSSARMLVSDFAERTGFEPVSRFRRLHAFQACLFSHSSIFPLRSANITIIWIRTNLQCPVYSVWPSMNSLNIEVGGIAAISAGDRPMM